MTTFEICALVWWAVGFISCLCWWSRRFKIEWFDLIPALVWGFLGPGAYLLGRWLVRESRK